MAKAPYEPPKQSIAGQTIDSLFLLALVFAALFTPLYLGLAGGGHANLEFTDKSWAGMGQNEAMVAQWDKLGMAKDEAGNIPQATVDLLASRFDYSFDPLWLAITALVVIAYFYIVFHWSAKEYREVIDEKFNNK